MCIVQQLREFALVCDAHGEEMQSQCHRQGVCKVDRTVIMEA